MSSVRGTPIDPDDLDPSRLGREGFVQRLLTRLILGCDPSGWNRPALPTKRGLEFVIRFEELCLGSHGNTDLHFVDEFELPSRHPEERAGWPDYAVVRVERLLLIELKTERNSHQRGQLSRYNDLARTHHPEVARDLVYVTPTMWLRDEPQPGIGERFRHVSWAELRPLIAATRTMAPDPIEQRRLERLLETLDAVEAPSPSRPPTSIRTPAAQPRTVEPSADRDDVERGLHQAALVQLDGAQRALEMDVRAPDELEDLGIELAHALRGGPFVDGVTVTHVLPWLWRTDLKGQPMTECGRHHGYEIRFSRYKRPPWGRLKTPDNGPSAPAFFGRSNRASNAESDEDRS